VDAGAGSKTPSKSQFNSRGKNPTSHKKQIKPQKGAEKKNKGKKNHTIGGGGRKSKEGGKGTGL